MQISSEVLAGTYLQKLLQDFPDYRPEDFWSLICSGSDLNHPYDGWSGVVAVPLFSDAVPFELFFGEFPDTLAAYENIPRFMISEDVSKLQAFSELRSYIDSITDHPVFISANAARWCLPIVTEAVTRDSGGPWNAQLICLRDLYSHISKELPVIGSTYIGDVFGLAPALPTRFGLQAIASALDKKVPDSTNKAMHRAKLTAEAACALLTKQYPLQ